MTRPTVRAVFLPSGHRGEFEPGTGLLDAARRLGVDLDSVCGGRALCGRCQVSCTEGHFAKHAIDSVPGNLSPQTAAEARLAERGLLATGRRLACQARIGGDVVIDVPAESQVHRQLVRKAAEARAMRINPAIRLHVVELAQPALDDPRGDRERLLDALREEWALANPDIALPVLQQLQAALRDGDRRVTVAVHGGTRVIAVWPGYRDVALGAAVDIGSTTIAVHLCDLHGGEVLASGGAMNPQIRFGEDLMSRVSYAMMNPDGAVALTACVRDAINALIGDVARQAGHDAADVLEVTLAGNPIMHHILLGISPVELGSAPFALAVDTALAIPSASIGIDISPGGRAYVLPCIAGHVGADAAAMILAEQPHASDEMTLLIDIGTNAEIVLGNRHRLLACSSPTGPAFEGAQISCGQRAAPGAIERVRIDPDSLEPRVRVIGCDRWSDEPGFGAAGAGLRITGICGSGIIEAVAELFLAGVITPDGVIDGGAAARSARVVNAGRTWSYVLCDADVPIAITQNDVRQIQLAKAALYAGVKLLMERIDIDSVDRIRLAGAFGSQIDVRYAMALGLIPDCALERVGSAGNAAGTGGRIALLDTDARATVESLVRRIEKVETAVEPRFQAHFIDAMAIPHRTDSFDRLFETLPRPRPGASAPVRRRRRPRTEV